MQALLLLLYRNRVLFTFIFLELFAFWLVVNNNDYQRIAFLSTSNRAVGSILSTTNSVEDYLNLSDKNLVLMDENARLREQVEHLRDGGFPVISSVIDTTGSVVDSTELLYNVIPAKVVNNTIFLSNNHLTINAGRNKGVEPGMGVLSSFGIVGKVKAVSDHYSTVYSILHQGMEVSCVVKKNNELATLKWEFNDYRYADLKFIVRDVDVSKGDTIITSGYNSVFPSEQLVGVVDEVEIDINKRFKKVKVELATNFSKLSHVYVAGLKTRNEKDSLEVNTFSN